MTRRQSVTGRRILNSLKLLEKKFIVGIDLGFSSIKLVQLAKRENGLALIRTHLKELTHSEDALLRDKERLDVLRELLKEFDKNQTKFIVAFNCGQTALRVITVPTMPKAEMREAIRYEAKNYFHFPIEDCAFDFEILDEIQEKGIKKCRVIVAVSPRKTVDEIVALFKKVGVTPFSLTSTSCALQKLAALTRRPSNQIECLIDMGGKYTELIIVRGKDLIFSRKVPIGGHDFTLCMTGVLASDRGRTALNLEEAEKIKREIGIPESGEEVMIAGKITTAQILSTLHSPLEQLIGEINRCFDYYREETGGEMVSSIVLLGRGAKLKGLSHSLAEQWGIPTKPGNPLEGLRLDVQLVSLDEGFAPYAAALGAALSQGKGINLLPPEIKDEIQRTIKRATIQSISVALALILAFVYIGMQIQLGNFKKRISVTQLERESLRLELENVAQQSVIHSVLADEPYWDDIFKELSNIIPSTVYLDALEMQNQILTMKGTITSTDREGILSDFMRDLEQGLFKNVKLVTSREKSDKSVTEFKLEAELD